MALGGAEELYTRVQKCTGLEPLWNVKGQSRIFFKGRAHEKPGSNPYCYITDV